ncbi:peptide ABC transporter substrate-binding protein [Corynebacterium hiratae]|uniref:ABC transporter substrate-binding protein n=1 Tax=Corynebacterium hiratae TaxID=3139423 RepID=A0A553G1K1_9CORY|nr:ABC transporter substrate-binding protein [Corynebacterium aurimucosum]TRX63380.1 ABC transporter substrate-binding protein [Corynebacterium aurimucosum]
MQWTKVGASLAAVVAATGLTACGGDGSGDAADVDFISTNSTEPQKPLIPADTSDVPGATLIDLIYSGLVYFDENGEVHNDQAESIEKTDDVTYKVTLKEDAVFSDGSPVRAQDYVDTWNNAVKNSMLSAYFFEPIKGYEEGAESMEGLKVVDEKTFTIELDEPTADFETRLGYSVFFPMHESAFDDIDAYGQNPVGSGPYKLQEWNHNQNAILVPNEKYEGDRKAQNDGLNFVFYADASAAYADLLSGNLDVLDSVPSSAMANFETDLGERAVNEPAAIFQSITIPAGDENFSGEAGALRRQALSMAIDREEITQTIFQGTNTPAVDFTSPVLNDGATDIPGNEVLTYNPDKARELWAKAEEMKPFKGPFTVAYNSDGSHKEWVDAVVNFIRNTLDIDAQPAPYPDFKSLRDEVTNKTIEGAFRTGWQSVYPSPSSFLEPLYATGAATNDADYSNPEFDSLLKKAAAAASEEESVERVNDAQAVLMKDLPAIPLWYTNSTGGYSERVDDVIFTWKSKPLYYKVTLK